MDPESRRNLLSLLANLEIQNLTLQEFIIEFWDVFSEFDTLYCVGYYWVLTTIKREFMLKKRTFAYPTQRIQGQEHLSSNGLTVQEYAVIRIAASLANDTSMSAAEISKRSVEIANAVIADLKEAEKV